MRYDRDELLARTDLAELADELLGWHTGNGRGARWPSPVPNHPQTGKTPPMSIFVDHRGVERWTCFATGANGTAIDLVTVSTGRSVGDAMTWLAERARLDRPPPERRAPVRRAPPREEPAGPSEALVAYVEACERILWQPAGRAVREWLVDERWLDPDVLRMNRVGADPGRRTLPRAKGLPWRGPAAVFPALDDERHPVYLQARYLHPPAGRGKYDNPTAKHGANPRATVVETPTRQCAPTMVTEGVPDGLAAASAGYRAVSILGAGVHDGRVAARIHSLVRDDVVAIAFDRDPAGRTGSERLAHALREQGCQAVEVTPCADDLNAWLKERGPDVLRQQMDRQVRLALPARVGQSRGRSMG